MNLQGQTQEFGPAISFDSKGVEFGPWIARFVAQVRRNWFIPMAAMTMNGHVVVTFYVHKDGRITDVTVAKPSPIDAFTLSARNAILASNPTVPLPPEYPDEKAFFTVTFFFNENPGGSRDAAVADAAGRPAHRPRRTGWARVRSRVRRRAIALTCPRLSRSSARRHGKSALGIALAERLDGEVVSCDSTAVYRGFDIGTDKVPVSEQRGIPHHMIDVADPLEEYSAARYAREAAAVIRDITARGRLPILVGGTGFYYRALTRGLFPGPSRDPAMRARLEAIAAEARTRAAAPLAGAGRSSVRRARHAARSEAARSCARGLSPHRAAADAAFRRDDVAAAGIRRRGLRAGDSTGRDGRSGGAPGRRAVRAGPARRDPRDCWRPACPRPRTRSPAWSTGRRSSILHGVRGERETRELIVRENRRYARRQLIWFRKEPNLRWIHAAGQREETLEEVARALAAMESVPDGPADP